MLVLSRQKDETIVIGENIEVMVVDIRGDNVRLGVIAPHTVPIHRREVYDEIRRKRGSTCPKETRLPILLSDLLARLGGTITKIDGKDYIIFNEAEQNLRFA